MKMNSTPMKLVSVLLLISMANASSRSPKGPEKKCKGDIVNRLRDTFRKRMDDQGLTKKQKDTLAKQRTSKTTYGEKRAITINKVGMEVRFKDTSSCEHFNPKKITRGLKIRDVRGKYAILEGYGRMMFPTSELFLLTKYAVSGNKSIGVKSKDDLKTTLLKKNEKILKQLRRKKNFFEDRLSTILRKKIADLKKGEKNI